MRPLLVISAICLVFIGLGSAAKVSDAPKLVGILEELNIPEESNATITCSLGSGKLEGLTYQWYKDKERLFTGSAYANIRIEAPIDNYQSVLRIVNLKPSDSALYTCLASNRHGQDKISTKLNVRVQLKWISEPSPELRLPVGKQSVHVPCSAEGSPQPRIEWLRLNSTTSDDGNNNDVGENSILGPELRFSTLSQRDAGYYECRASNGVEEDLVARVRLDVLADHLAFMALCWALAILVVPASGTHFSGARHNWWGVAKRPNKPALQTEPDGYAPFFKGERGHIPECSECAFS